MRKAYTTFIVLCTFLISYGQKELRDVVNVTGTVRDSATNQPLANATVRLTRLQNPAHSYSTVADNAGHFTIRQVLTGTYELSVEVVGYTVHSEKNIVLDTSKTDWDLAPIYLPTKSKTLGNVVVTGSRSLIENKIDRVDRKSVV